MKVILIKDVKATGKKDDILEVKDGYADYLIKNKLAVKYTLKSNEKLISEISERERNEQKLVKECAELKNKLEKEKLTFKVKSGVNGKIFGVVTTKQISEALTKLGFSIDKKKIKLTSELSTLGTHKVKILLHKEVEATLDVTIGSDING